MAENPYHQALEYLGPNGEHWFQGDLVDNEYRPTRACILGALRETDVSVLNEESDGYSPEYLFLRDIIRELFPELFPENCNATGGVAYFNDHPETTFDDVRAALEKAAIRWDEECDIRGTL